MNDLPYESINDVMAQFVAGFSSGSYQMWGYFWQQIAANSWLIPLCIEIVLGLIVLKIFYMIARLTFGTPRRLERFSSPAQPNGTRILIVGDSTAYGMGAKRNEDTIAGRLAHDFPHTEIINNAVGGSLTRNAVVQMQRTQESFDMIIVCTGGNDIWHFTRLSRLREDLRETLVKAIGMSGHHVIVFFYANMGYAPIFPFFLAWILKRRSEKVRTLFLQVSEEMQVPCIELYTVKGGRVDLMERNPFLENPKKYFAGDYMHPNSDGYALWYKQMWFEMVKRGYLFNETLRSTQPYAS